MSEVPHFKDTAHVALMAADTVLSHWLPGGKQDGLEYKPLNPTRADSKEGSFSINRNSGKWSDFATGDKGGDLISLIAYIENCGQGEAKRKLEDFLGLHSKCGVTGVTGVRPKHKGKKNNIVSAFETVTPSENVKRNKRNTPPVDAPAPRFHHNKHGDPSKVWTYHDTQGQPWFYVCRFDTPDGKKILPRSYDGKRWQWKGVDAPRTVYNLHLLARRPTTPVLFTEGEKAADAAAALFPDCVTSTTPNGSNNADKADLSPLNRRTVYIWPDNDEPGAQYADTLATLAIDAGAARVSILKLDKLPCMLPDKGDAADVTYWPPDTGEQMLTDADAWHEVQKSAEAPALPKNFTLNETGVYHRGTNKDGEPMPPLWVCGPLQVSAQTRDADGNAWGRLLEWRDNDDIPHRWAMPTELLAGDGSEYRRELLSQGLEIAPGNRARQLLTEYIQTAPVRTRARCANKTGWHGGVFVLSDETIGDAAERVLLQSLHEPAPMRTAGTLDGWRDNVAALCVGNSRLLLAVSTAFAGPLLDITGDESGGINFQGQSSTGKTTVLHAAVSVWGGPDFLQRWRATTNGLEATAQAHSDAVLCLDELAQVDAREAGNVAYMLANNTGKQRARRDGLAKPKATWRLLFLSAGEIGLAQHMSEAGKRARAGQEIRLIDIPADAGKDCGIFETLHSYPNGAALSDAIKEAARSHYGHPARDYLRQLVTMPRDKLRERLRDLRADFTSETLPANADGQARRLCDRFALIAAAGELATQMGLTGWTPGEATQGVSTCCAAWLDNRGGAGAGEERAALGQVSHFFELHGESRFTMLNGDDVADDRQRTINRAGFRRIVADGSTEFFVMREVWKAEICAGIDWKYAAQLCLKRGMIKPDSKGGTTRPYRLPGMGQERVYHFLRTSPGESENA